MLYQDLLLENKTKKVNHLYDNPDLTFGQLKEIFSSAAEGELEGSEITDGHPIMLSFSIKDGRVKASIDDVKNGALTPEKIIKNLNPELKDVFKDALSIFEKTIHGLSNEDQKELFGEDANIFYSAQIIDSRAPNVINYDTRTLVIQQNGHLVVNKDSNEEKNINSSKLINIIKDAQEQLKHDNYGIQVNAIKKLKALTDKRPLNISISKINTLLSNVNSLINNESLALSDDSTIAEYMTARVYILINSILQKGGVKSFDPIAKKNIAKWILGVKGISVSDISGKISKEQLEFVKENILNNENRKEILNTAISPLENIISDFSSEMLRGLESAFIIDNIKELQRLKKNINLAVATIKKSDNEELLSTVKKEISKLKNIENIDSATEGFKFNYDGKQYQFNGNFSPISKILKIFKNNNSKDIKENTEKNIIYDIINEQIIKVKFSLLKKNKNENTSVSSGAVAFGVKPMDVNKTE